MRRFAYWGLLGSIGGYTMANGTAAGFWSGWEAALNSPYNNDATRLNGLLNSVHAWRLVPDRLGGIGTLVTAGGGSENTDDYVAAAATPHVTTRSRRATTSPRQDWAG